jgi:hypothetical protein
MPIKALLTFICTAALIGCSSLATEPPLNYNLTGEWQLNAALSDSPNLTALGKKTDQQKRGARGQRGGEKGQGRGQRRGEKGGGEKGGGEKGGGGKGSAGNGSGPPSGGGGRGSQAAFSVAVLFAKDMSIEQNFESMGVEYNATKYMDMNYRDVSWGERKRGLLTIETGWEEGNLIIKTEGSRLPIEETYILSEDSSRLTVIIELDGGKDGMTFTRVFENVSAKADA